MKTDVSGFPEKRPPTGHSQSEVNFNTEQDRVLVICFASLRLIA